MSYNTEGDIVPSGSRRMAKPKTKKGSFKLFTKKTAPKKATKKTTSRKAKKRY